MSELNEKDGQATYSPEDNKLRLYVGRVPRDEFLRLRADGWTTLHKQREAGGGDFVAIWTPSRRDTALEYADIIEDEDMGPAERAADRAERFSGYRDKRTDEATGHADAYDSQPGAHGYQSAARAQRSAARHDRIADRAGDAWSKAEYWTRRTAGVIGHALYKSTPGVRMGRIKELEALLRKHEKETERKQTIWGIWQRLAAITDPAKQTEQIRAFVGSISMHGEYPHPDDQSSVTSIFCHMTTERRRQITGAEALAMWFSDHQEPAADDDWSLHYRLRLAYENQMLEAQGGRLEQCDVLPGGKLGGKLILKVNKSAATGRATSVSILGPRVEGHAYRAGNIPGTEWAEYQFDLERLSPGSYTPPTPESLAELEMIKAAIKAGAPVKDACPLINPTDADAERLQALWNERARAAHEANNTWKSPEARVRHAAEFKPATVTRITQAVYSANSKGICSRAETRGLCRDAQAEDRHSDMWSSERSERAKRRGPAVCKVRLTTGGKSCGWSFDSIIVLTDKPQKALPSAVWEKYTAPAVAPQTANA